MTPARAPINALNKNGLAGTVGLSVSVGLAVAATVLGSWIADRLHRETAPVIVIVAAAAFLITLFGRST